jgi:hypothetical protein
MKSLQSINRMRAEAQYISRSWSGCSEHVYRDQPAKYMPDSVKQYGSQENKARWYSLEVRENREGGGQLFISDIITVANVTRNPGSFYFNQHSNPEDLFAYIDRTKYTVTYKGESI